MFKDCVLDSQNLSWQVTHSMNSFWYSGTAGFISGNNYSRQITTKMYHQEEEEQKPNKSILNDEDTRNVTSIHPASKPLWNFSYFLK